MNKKELNEIKALLENAPRLATGGKELRVKKAQNDFRYAVCTYFSHHINFKKKDSSTFRNFIYDNIKIILDNNKNFNIESYRGAAKTTLITRLLVLWLMAIKKVKRHTPIISSTIDLSKESLEFIKTELEENQNLIYDFNIQIGSKFNGKWTDEEIVFKSGALKFRIKVYGSTKKIRGVNWLGIRPDLIICDDLENDENVQTKAQRDKLEQWFKKAILKLPSRMSKNYNIIVVGTKLHHDSLIARISKRNDFKSFSFPLVLRFPLNLSEITKENVKKGDEKGMLLDDKNLNKYELLLDYLEDKDSFFSEFQNQPLSSENAIFSTYTTYKGDIPKCDMYSIALDPSMGKKNGDYFGIAILGFMNSISHEKEQKFYSKVYGYKQNPIHLIPKIIKLYIKFDTKARTILSVETVAYQEFFKDVLKKEASKVGVFLNVKEYKNTAAKELRLNSLSPLIKDETILINEDDNLLIQELQTYPKAAHDDLLDALEMAYRNFKVNGKIDYKIVNRVFLNKRALRISKYS